MRQDKGSFWDLIKSQDFLEKMSVMQKYIKEEETVQICRAAAGEYSEEEALELAEAYNSGKNIFPELKNTIKDAEESDYSEEEAKALAEAYNSGENIFPELKNTIEDVEEFEYSEEEALELAEAYNSGKNIFPLLKNKIEDAEESDCSEEEAKALAEAYNNRSSRFSELEISVREGDTCSEKVSERVLVRDGKFDSKNRNGTLKTKNRNAKAHDMLTEPAYQYALKIMSKIDLKYLDAPECSSGISRYNGLYWEVLNDEQLKDIVYQHITENNLSES